MKIVIIGGTGTIGRKVAENFSKGNEVVTAGTKSGDFRVDITSTESIKSFFENLGPFDALVSATGSGHFGPLKNMTAIDFQVGLNSKLLGQINLVLMGQHFISANGSFTLSSGVLAEDPILNGVNLSTVNAGINAFAKAAAIELQNGVRINAVSAGVVEDSPELHGAFPGHIPVRMDVVVNAFRKSVFGALTGQTIVAV